MLRKNKDTEEDESFWEVTRRARIRVESWPEWKRNVKVSIYSTGFGRNKMEAKVDALVEWYAFVKWMECRNCGDMDTEVTTEQNMMVWTLDGKPGLDAAKVQLSIMAEKFGLALIDRAWQELPSHPCAFIGKTSSYDSVYTQVKGDLIKAGFQPVIPIGVKESFKGGAKMASNPYPETIVDESSGEEVRNREHELWQEGYDARVENEDA